MCDFSAAVFFQAAVVAAGVFLLAVWLVCLRGAGRGGACCKGYCSNGCSEMSVGAWLRPPSSVTGGGAGGDGRLIAAPTDDEENNSVVGGDF